MKYVICEKCENLYIHPDIEGVELSCGAFDDFSSLDVDKMLSDNIRPSFEKGLEIGDIRFNSVSSCGGQLKEITEEELEKFVIKLSEQLTFKGIREIR
jgi:hypothetical protein